MSSFLGEMTASPSFLSFLPFLNPHCQLPLSNHEASFNRNHHHQATIFDLSTEQPCLLSLSLCPIIKPPPTTFRIQCQVQVLGRLLFFYFFILDLGFRITSIQICCFWFVQRLSLFKFFRLGFRSVQFRAFSKVLLGWWLPWPPPLLLLSLGVSFRARLGF